MGSAEIKIPWAKPAMGPKEREYVLDALGSTWISGGPYVDRFEAEFRHRCGAEFGLAVSNGTTALHLALLALDIGPGDEVIVPGFTFVAPANMVLAVGGAPVFVDVDPETWLIDPALIERAITKKTKAIIVVHLYGNVCDMDPIREIADRRGLSVIEDTAEAAFSKYKGRCAGTFGDAGSFSFHATKTITMGEGGFVFSRDAGLEKKMRMIRDHGMRPGKRYWHDVVGYNFRVTNLQAALGCAQLEAWEDFARARGKMVELYRENLAGIPGVTLQAFRPEVSPVVWAVAVKIDQARFQGGRDSIIERLLESGIETRPGFYPFGSMPLYRAPRLPVSDDVGSKSLSLPSFSGLAGSEISYICEQLKRLGR